MKARQAEFVKSATTPPQYPAPDLPEIAIAGRSNVGKSSLINTMVGRAGLAKTSNTPGRTQLLNWFRVTSARGRQLHLVDLPGYGYAKVPQAMRAAWRPMIQTYLEDREVLRGMVVLIDARRGPQDDEVSLVEWLHDAGIGVVVALTKCDKLPKSKRKPVLAQARVQLGLARDPVATSASKGDGMDELWHAILALVGPAA